VLRWCGCLARWVALVDTASLDALLAGALAATAAGSRAPAAPRGITAPRAAPPLVRAAAGAAQRALLDLGPLAGARGKVDLRLPTRRPVRLPGDPEPRRKWTGGPDAETPAPHVTLIAPQAATE
jgi:hypothetical protein